MKTNKFHLWLLGALDAMVARIHWYFSDERHDPDRCCKCGSTHVQLRAWVYPNLGNKYDGDCEDLPGDENWCVHCNGYTHIRPTSDMLDDAIAWWEDLDFKDMERITGLRQADFSAQDGYQGFVDSASAWWEQQTTDQKIRCWLEIIDPKVEQ